MVRLIIRKTIVFVKVLIIAMVRSKTKDTPIIRTKGFELIRSLK